MPNFQRFDRRATPTPGHPFVTIQREGRLLSLNAVAYELIGTPEAVELNFDPDERLIGIRSCDSKEPWSYGVHQMGNSNTWTVGARAFTQHWGIDTSVALRYPATLKDGYLIIDIKQKGTDVTGPKSRIKNATGLRRHYKTRSS